MSKPKTRPDGLIELDTTDVDRWIGKPLGGARLKEPVDVNDIRRWAQGMQNPNPLYYDERYAAEGVFGRIVAPQSFAVCTDTSHGAGPAIQGHIPGQHMIFGGDEWWFFGPRILPGDQITHDRMLFDYKVAETKFAGPTMFSRGDTTYINQRGEVICKQRSTSVRYLAENARKLGMFAGQPGEAVDRRGARGSREAEDGLLPELPRSRAREAPVREGGRQAADAADRPAHDRELHHRVALLPDDGLGRRARSTARARTTAAGWLPEMSRDREGAKIDPANADGLYKGPSRGHVQPRYAQLIGMPRGYGYGASMGAWVIDYLVELGRRVELHHLQQHAVPLARADRRRHLPERRGRRGRARRPVRAIRSRRSRW